MDLDLIRKGLESTYIRKRKWILIVGAFGFTAFGAYKIYSSPSFAKKRQRLLKLFVALFVAAEVVYDSPEAVAILCRDMKEFLASSDTSDHHHIPQSFKQLSKITVSNELTQSSTHTTSAVRDSGFTDRVLDRLFSDKGCGFASTVVGSFARNLVMAFSSSAYDHYRTANLVPTWIEVASGDKYRGLIGDFTRAFVTTAVTVYLDKTTNINTYDEIFSGLTNPRHEGRVRELLASVCNGAVETYIKTANHIASSDFFCRPNHNIAEAKSFSATLGSEKQRDSITSDQEMGWITKVSSALAVPRNKKFVLDITGTVTFESVRSFLEFSVQKLWNCVERSVDLFRQEVVGRGAEAIKSASSTSSAVITVCVTLCSHILDGPWLFTYYA